MSPREQAVDRALPTGAVTFLMSDIEGSGAHWIAHPREMAASMRGLDAAATAWPSTRPPRCGRLRTGVRRWCRASPRSTSSSSWRPHPTQASLPGRDDTFPPLRTGSTHGPAVMAVVLVDICRASGLTASDRHVDLLAEQRRWMSGMRRISEAHGAASLKVLGDGCLVAFEDPANGVAFARSLRAEIAESGLQIRAGVAAGRVELFDGEVMGRTTFDAAELMQTALPGQILTSDTLRDLVDGADDASS